MQLIKRSLNLIIVLLLLAATATTAAAQNSKRIKQLREQSTALKKQIAESETALKSTKKDVNSQLNNLAIINSHIDAQQKIVDGYHAEVNTISGQIATLQQQRDTLAAELEQYKHKYRKALIYINRNRLLQNKLTFVLMSKNFRQMYRRMRYAANYSTYLRAQALAVKKKEEDLRAKQQELQTAKQEKDALLTDARQQQTALNNQKAERQTVIAELNKKQAQLQSNIKQQRRKQANLDAQIDKLIKQEIAAAEARRKREEARRKAEAEKRRKAEEAKAREEARKNEAAKKGKGKSGSSSKKNKDNTSSSSSSSTSKTPRYEEEDATDRTVSSGFEANKGRLPVPISGSYAVTSRYGQYNVEGLSGVTLDSKGINLTGKSGAQARCVYDGEVTAVANIGGSYIVIVRHGNYYSVYSNLASVSVRDGQKVTMRQTLGSVARDAAGNCTLHFQLRRRSGSSANHINPLPWLAR